MMNNLLLTFLAVGIVICYVTTGVLTIEDCACAGKTIDTPGALTNLARDDGVTVFMSSLKSYHRPASEVNDGIYVPQGVDWALSASLTHTRKEVSPWIQFDLGRTRCIKGVKIWNRSKDGKPSMDAFKNARINVEDKAGYGPGETAGKCAYSPGTQPAVRFHPCEHGPMCGRYVRVTAVDVNDKLNLYEIEIHGW